jgi:hypothetical protein
MKINSLLLIILASCSLSAVEKLTLYIKNETKKPIIAYLKATRFERLPIKNFEQYTAVYINSEELIQPQQRIGPMIVYNPQQGVGATENYEINLIEVAKQDSAQKKIILNMDTIVKKFNECNKKVVEIVLKESFFGDIDMHPRCELTVDDWEKEAVRVEK